MISNNDLADGELVVVETDEDAFLGTAEFTDSWLVLRNGYVGRPTLIAPEEVRRITPAFEHPDVEGHAATD